MRRASRTMDQTTKPPQLCSHFLNLPTELRCYIYDHLCSFSTTVTISAGYVTARGERISNCAFRPREILGLPLGLVPLVRNKYDVSLLKITEPVSIPVEHVGAELVAGAGEDWGMPPSVALSRTCGLVRAEMADHAIRRRINSSTVKQKKNDKKANDLIVRKSKSKKEENLAENEGLSVYVSYPYGVMILKSFYPYLAKQARRIIITGYHSTDKAPAPREDYARGSNIPTEFASTLPMADGFDPMRARNALRSFIPGHILPEPVTLRYQRRAGLLSRRYLPSHVRIMEAALTTLPEKDLEYAAIVLSELARMLFPPDMHQTQSAASPVQTNDPAAWWPQPYLPSLPAIPTPLPSSASPLPQYAPPFAPSLPPLSSLNSLLLSSNPPSPPKPLPLHPSPQIALTIFFHAPRYSCQVPYDSVWSHTSSPVTRLLRNICGGEIDMAMKRGETGTAVRVEVLARPEERRLRCGWSWWKGERDAVERFMKGEDVGMGM